jgi:hypothetical protein
MEFNHNTPTEGDSRRGGALYGIKVPMTQFKAISNRVYWIELRDGFGFDASLAPQNRGFVVSVANDFSCIPTCAIDAHPETQTMFVDEIDVHSVFGQVHDARLQ